MPSMIVDQFNRPYPSARERAQEMVRARWDAAQTTTDNQNHWLGADALSPQAAATPWIRRTLRNRCRYECYQNNCFGSGIVRSIAYSVVGTGPRLQLLTPNESHNQEVQAKFHAWAKTVKLARTLRTARSARAVDGETIVLQSINRRLRTPVKLWPRAIECDHLTDPEGLFQSTSENDDGVFFDGAFPARYRITDRHPGDLDAAVLTYKDLDAEYVIHWFRPDRPGQQRGIPELAPALPLFADLRRFTQAVIAAAETGADLAGVIETQGLGTEEQPSENIRTMEPIPIERRALLALPKGWKAQAFKTEQPATTYAMFRDAILNEIARCVLMPMNLASGNSSNYNFASGRLDHKAWANLVAIERDEIETDILDTIFLWWLEEAMFVDSYLPDDLPAFADLSYRWLWDKEEYVDPAKEATFTEKMWNMGFLSDDEYLASRKIDPKQHFERLARDLERRRRLGLPLPGAVTADSLTDMEDEDEKEEAAGVAARMQRILDAYNGQHGTTYALAN